MRTIEVKFGMEIKPRLVHADELNGIRSRLLKKQELTAYDISVIDAILAACVDGSINSTLKRD